MAIAKRLFPILMGATGELDVVEVDNTIRNAWMAVFALQEDATALQETIDGAIRRGEMAANDDAVSVTKVATQVQRTVAAAPTSITGAALVNPISGRLPVINGSLELEGGLNAPEYNLSTKALTIRGALNISGASTLTGAVTMAGTLAVTGAVTLTVPLAVPQGGTGAATFTDHGIMLGSGTGILTVLGSATNGQLPIGSTGNDPVLGTLTGTSLQLAVANGAGSITLSLPSAVTMPGSLIVTTTLSVLGTTTTLGRIKTVTRKTTTATILVTDSVIFGNTDSAGWTATLPAGVSGQTFTIINSGSSGNVLTIAPNGSEHLLGVNSNFVLFDAETLDLTYDSTDGWY